MKYIDEPYTLEEELESITTLDLDSAQMAAKSECCK